MARREIQQKLQLKLGVLTSQSLARHNSMAILLNAALGGKSDTPAPSKPGQSGVKDLAAGHADVHAAIAAINQAMTI